MTTTPLTTAASGPPASPYVTGLFAPVLDEVDAEDLVIHGELPEAIRGSYYRNGANTPYTPPTPWTYPIDGDGMVHEMAISEGRAHYRNRFVRTPMIEAELAAKKALWATMMGGAMPLGEVPEELKFTPKDLPDVNIVRHDGRLLALAETTRSYCLDPTTLATLGPETWDGAYPMGHTAHPKIDPVTGEMILFAYTFAEPYLTWAVIGADGSVVQPPTGVAGFDATYMIHDCAITERYLLLLVNPAVFTLDEMMKGGSPLQWQPERGSRTVLVPRDGSAPIWLDADRVSWCWHIANAYDSADEVVVDWVRWDHLQVGDQVTENSGALVRTTLRPAVGTSSTEVLHEGLMEFPRIDDRRIGQHHSRIAMGAKSGRPGLIPGEFDSVLTIRPDTGEAAVFDGGDLVVGEPCFVPDPAAEGWFVTFGTDRTTLRSSFIVLSAEDVSAGPIARVDLPVRVPNGLHGAWAPTAG